MGTDVGRWQLAALTEFKKDGVAVTFAGGKLGPLSAMLGALALIGGCEPSCWDKREDFRNSSSACSICMVDSIDIGFIRLTTLCCTRFGELVEDFRRVLWAEDLVDTTTFPKVTSFGVFKVEVFIVLEELEPQAVVVNGVSMLPLKSV